MTDTTQYSVDDGLIEVGGAPPISIWVQTCPNHVDRHPRYRERFTARAATLTSLGDRIVREPSASAGPRISRNAPCPCGSGRKYKKCCEAASALR